MNVKNNLSEPVFPRSAMRLAAAAVIILAAICSQAVTIVSGPQFAQATNAPLAGLLTLATDVDSRVSVSVDDGIETWERTFFDYGTNHSVPLLGFKPGRINEITVTVRDKFRNQFTVSAPLLFVTAPLPANFPKIVLRTNDTEHMEPGYTLFQAVNTGSSPYVTIVDNEGEVVWYSPLPTAADVRQLTNGDLFLPTSDTKGFAEFNMLGQKVRTWLAPTALPVDSHDGVPTPHGTILYLNKTTRVVTNYPSSATDSNAPLRTATVSCNRAVEISAADSAILNNWSLIDLLDPVRIDYLTFLSGIDGEHANAVIEDPRDNSVIVSLRNQDAVIKISRATGQLKWILGPHENWGPQWQPYLLTPVGTPLGWQYGQHAPILTPQGTLLLYDDGNARAEPFAPPVADQNNYSRAVEFSIDETNMQVSQVWDYGRTNTSDRLYTDRVGSADWLPQSGHVLVTFGYVLYENGSHPSAAAPNATMVRIKEVTHDPVPAVVFDLQVFDSNNNSPSYAGCLVYRSHRIPDLYGHPASPVAGLIVRLEEGQPLLQFSADPTRTYAVQVSDDLANWLQIGVASPDESSGDFSFLDARPDAFSAQFYRVVTQ